jgi:hypothetical protein
MIVSNMFKANTIKPYPTGSKGLKKQFNCLQWWSVVTKKVRERRYDGIGDGACHLLIRKRLWRALA